MCNHISIVLPNRPGELGKVCAMLACNSVNILGHQLASQGNSSIVHLLCDPHERAYDTLRREYRFYCNEKKVLIVAATHVPGEFGRILRHLSERELNLESSYQAVLDNQILLVLELKDRESTTVAEKLLLKSSLGVLKRQPIAA
jgi:hypothetical protein